MTSRLDKLLSNATALTRKEAHKVIRQGAVKVDDVPVKNPAQHISNDAQLKYLDVVVNQPLPRYIMFHKPVDVVCANKDSQHQTVFDYLFLPRAENLHIAGRLDKDTTGLVLISDDGQWIHRITSPKHQHQKVYRVGLQTPPSAQQIKQIEEGVQLKGEKNKTRPASLAIIDEKLVQLTLSEGKYHQVKRMFAALGNHVVTLHRQEIAGIRLDDALGEGEWRALSENEIKLVY